MPISLSANSRSRREMNPLPVLSNSLKASKRLKSFQRASCFLISSISLSLMICCFKALTKCSSSLPLMGDLVGERAEEFPYPEVLKVLLVFEGVLQMESFFLIELERSYLLLLKLRFLLRFSQLFLRLDQDAECWTYLIYSSSSGSLLPRAPLFLGVQKDLIEELRFFTEAEEPRILEPERVEVGLDEIALTKSLYEIRSSSSSPILRMRAKISSGESDQWLDFMKQLMLVQSRQPSWSPSMVLKASTFVKS